MSKNVEHLNSLDSGGVLYVIYFLKVVSANRYFNDV